MLLLLHLHLHYNHTSRVLFPVTCSGLAISADRSVRLLVPNASRDVLKWTLNMPFTFAFSMGWMAPLSLFLSPLHPPPTVFSFRAHQTGRQAGLSWTDGDTPPHGLANYQSSTNRPADYLNRPRPGSASRHIPARPRFLTTIGKTRHLLTLEKKSAIAANFRVF